jgi:hypothetical protein
MTLQQHRCGNGYGFGYYPFKSCDLIKNHLDFFLLFHSVVYLSVTYKSVINRIFIRFFVLVFSLRRATLEAFFTPPTSSTLRSTQTASVGATLVLWPSRSQTEILQIRDSTDITWPIILSSVKTI